MAVSVAKLLCQPRCCQPFAVTRFARTQPRREEPPPDQSSAAPDGETVPFEAVSREKSVRISTCGPLFEQWRKERRYWSVHKSALQFDVPYIDTGYHAGASSKSSPTVLALHGSPGSYTDFHPISSRLYRQGVRIVALNFPGSDQLKPKEFRHTPEEKSQYVRDFLKELRIPSVDMLLCHSSALFTGLPLCLDSKEVSVNSVAILNPTALQIPKTMQPYWLIHALIRSCEVDLGLRISKMVIRMIANSLPELKKGKFEEHLLSAFVLAQTDIPKQAAPFASLVRRGFPILLAYSENDKLISKRASDNMAAMMIDTGEIERYDKDSKLLSGGSKNPFRRAMSFSHGTHFLTKTNPQLVSDAIATFLFQHFHNRR